MSRNPEARNGEQQPKNVSFLDTLVRFNDLLSEARFGRTYELREEFGRMEIAVNQENREDQDTYQRLLRYGMLALSAQSAMDASSKGLDFNASRWFGRKKAVLDQRIQTHLGMLKAQS